MIKKLREHVVWLWRDVRLSEKGIQISGKVSIYNYPIIMYF